MTPELDVGHAQQVLFPNQQLPASVEDLMVVLLSWIRAGLRGVVSALASCAPAHHAGRRRHRQPRPLQRTRTSLLTHRPLLLIRSIASHA